MKKLAGWIQAQGGWSALADHFNKSCTCAESDEDGDGESDGDEEGCGDCVRNNSTTLIRLFRGGGTVVKCLTFVVCLCVLIAGCYTVVFM